MSDMDIDRHLRAKVADLTEECKTLRAAFRDMNEANEKLLDQNFALAAGQCANVVGDEGGTPQCKRIGELCTALADACELLEGWIGTKCPPRFQAEHMEHVQKLRGLLRPTVN